MKMFKILFILALMPFALYSCKDDDDAQKGVAPTITSLDIKNQGSILMSDSVYFNAVVSSSQRPLSTLEVQVIANNEVISSRSIRTKGNEVSLKNYAIAVPFVPYVSNNDPIDLIFTLINIDGVECVVKKSMKAQRPNIPQTLYLLLSDNSVVELNQSANDPMVYESQRNIYKNTFSTKVSSDKQIDKASVIWVGSTDDNMGMPGTKSGGDIKVSYLGWIVRKIIFDTYSFSFDIDGEKMGPRKVKGTELKPDGEYYHASIDFTNNETFEMTGIVDLEGAYNRDFFEYDTQTGKFKFTGATGKWDVYYDETYNYTWVTNMKAVAPATYWIVGAGYTNVPRWYDAFTDMGWDLEDVRQLGHMKSLGAGKYQSCIYLANPNGDIFDVQFYGDLEWGRMCTFATDAISGDITGIRVHPKTLADIVQDEGFVPGYYRVTLDVSAGEDKAKAKFERLHD